MPKTTQVVEEVEAGQELVLLRGFRDLVSEGLGYHFGAKAVSAEAKDNEEVGKLRHAIPRVYVVGRPKKDTDKKAIIIEDLVKSGDTNAYLTAMTEVGTAKTALQAAMKPYNERKNPLDRAWKYCVGTAFPDALKELGAPVNPRFKLSDWIKDATAKKKK